MAKPYTPFPIKSFKSGINTYLKPWIRPEDAFDPLVNAFVNRGAVNKRAGFSQFGDTLSFAVTITGIDMAVMATITADNTFTSDDYGITSVIFSEVVGMTEINGLSGIVQSATPTDFVVDIDTSAFTMYTSDGIATYIPLEGTENPVMGIMRYIDESDASTDLLVATTTNLYLYDPGSNSFGSPLVLPSAFTGTIANFFNWTNWQASEGAASYLYMTNNIDPLTLWDGTVVTQMTPDIDSSMSPQTIDTALDVQVYKNRLLLIRPTYSTDGSQNQTIAWSAQFDPTNFIQDVAGNGGFAAAPTGDIIQSAEFLRDQLIVFMTNSTWLFRFTGNAFEPFVWQKLNNSKNTNCPYASVAYDERATAIGNTGLIACDGVNVQRYDIPIIDYYEDSFSQNYYQQSFSQRYDNINQSWTLYVSNSTPYPVVGGVAPGSDSALVYNFVENTWATFTWPIPLTCLGLFNKTGTTTWADLPQAWEDTDVTWNSFAGQKDSIILLSGDTTGHVWLMNDEDSVTDNGTSIVPDIITTRWNPFVDLGQKTQFGHIDIYYLIASVDPENPIQVTLNFYIDNSDNYQLSRILTLDGPVNSEYAFKRIYINMIGEFIRMEIDPNVDSFMQFVGFILWAQPAGRLTGP